jgi:DNA-directed RNA polymerase subunit RPC12/RpoP
MGIRFYCPKGHKLNVKEFQAGKKALCPYCGLSVLVPTKSTRVSSRQRKAEQHSDASSPTVVSPLSFPSEPTPQPTPTSITEEALHGGMGSSIIIAGTHGAQAASAGNPPHVDPSGVLSGEDNSAAGASDASSVFGSSSDGMDSTLAELNRMLAEADRSSSVPTTKASAGNDALLQDADNTLWYIRQASGNQLGPATNSIMRHWLAKGRVQADSLVWHQGWPEWQLAGNVFEFSPAASPDDASQGMNALLSEEPVAPVVLPTHHAPPRDLKRNKQIKNLIIAAIVAGALLVLGVIGFLVAKNL